MGYEIAKENEVSFSKDNLFKCSYCPFVSPYSSLKLHMRKHTGALWCSTCGKGFSQKVNLKRHEQSHLLKKIYVCKLCQEKFLCLMSYNTHMLSHKMG